MKRIDYTGHRFGRLLVLEMIYTNSADSKIRCLCDCGKEKTVLAYNAKNGNTTSCGCFLDEKRIERGMLIAPVMGYLNTTHGLSRTSTYVSWQDAKKRCFSPQNKRYSYYGGRGILMCDRWRLSFQDFYADMGEKPKGLTLERIDVNKGYEPGNCKWASKTDQARNTRANVATMEIAMEIRSKRKIGIPLKELAEFYQMSYGNVQQIALHQSWKE